MHIRQIDDKYIYKYISTIVDEFISSNPDDPTDPLIRAGNLTQEDWCILEWNESLQAYVLTAGIVYFPMRWSLLEKWNQPMSGKSRKIGADMK